MHCYNEDIFYLQNKIRELEDKLQEERHHRKMLEEKAVEVCN